MVADPSKTPIWKARCGAGNAYLLETEMSFPYEEVTRLVGRIGKLGYGQSIAFARDDWMPAIPRADPMQQMFLAAGGHRPETERTPLDWVRFWINGTEETDFMRVKHEPFYVRDDPVSGALIVSLPESMCPKCQGRGWTRVWDDDLTASPMVAGCVPTSEVVFSKPVKCDHRKELGDKTNVRWP